MSDITTNYKNTAGSDLGKLFVDKAYVLDRYPELVDTFRFAGLWTWGKNAYGQLGDNTVVSKSSPVQTVAGGTNWKQVVVASTSINAFTAAIKTDGTLWLWGNNNFGQLGDNTIIQKSSPVQTVSAGTTWKQVACGYALTAAIKTDGTLWLWGYNNSGQLGDNTIASKSSPVQTVSAGTTWKQVACNNGLTAAIKTNGTLWTWGKNAYGQLGDNTVTNKSSPVQTVSAGTNWKQVACGYHSVAAVKTDGTLWSWGRDTFGQLGDNAVTHKSSPVQTVSAGTTWKQVACGYYTTAAIKTDGTLWLWGYNTSGQLGDNTVVRKSSPVQTVSAGTTWKQVTAAGNNTAAIKLDGTLWLWGDNTNGQLGNDTSGTGVNKSSPIQTTTGGTNWTQVSAGYNNVAAIRDNSSDLFT